MIAVLTRVNGDLYACTASHDDYVTAAASLTAVLIVRGHAYVMQCGWTAAYLAHGGDVVALSGDDVFDDRPGSLLSRALGIGPVARRCRLERDARRGRRDRSARNARAAATSSGARSSIRSRRASRANTCWSRGSSATTRGTIDPPGAEAAGARPALVRFAATVAFFVAAVFAR